jgi:hypothetical protein
MYSQQTQTNYLTYMKDSVLACFDLTLPIVFKRLMRCLIKKTQVIITFLFQPVFTRHWQLTWTRRRCHNLIIVLFAHTPRQKPALTPTQSQTPHFLCSVQYINGIILMDTRQHITRFDYIMTLTALTFITNVQLLLPRLARKSSVVNCAVDTKQGHIC